MNMPLSHSVPASGSPPSPGRRALPSRSSLVIKDRIAGVWLSAQRLGLFGLVPDSPGAPASDVVFNPPQALTLQQWSSLSPELQGWWLGLQEDLPPPAVHATPTTPYAVMVSRWVQSALVAAFPNSLKPPAMYDRATPMGQALARGLHAGLFADPQASAMATAWKISGSRSSPQASAPRTSATHPLYCAKVPVLLPDNAQRNPKIILDPGVVLITFCPGKNQNRPISGAAWSRNLDLDLDSLCAEKVTDVVSLITKEEMFELLVPDLGARIRDRGMNWFHLPIQDGRTPDGIEDNRTQHTTPFWSVQKSSKPVGDWSIRTEPRWPGEIIWGAPEYAILSILAGKLSRQGGRVVVHCKGGLGRAGTVAALLLAGAAHYSGTALPVDEVVAAIRSLRRDAIETAVQERFLARKIAPGLNPCSL